MAKRISTAGAEKSRGLDGGKIAVLVLDTVTRGRRETKLLAYLAQRAPGENSARP